MPEPDALTDASSISSEEVERGKRALVADGAWASTIGIMAGGVVLVGFALQIGATPFEIGLLAAIPFIGQLAQLPAIGLVQRFQKRRRLAVGLGLAERVMILTLAALPFLASAEAALALLILGQLVVAVLAATSACAWNSWMHDFLPREGLGAFFAKRLFWGTTVALIAGLTAGVLVDHWPGSDRIHAYSATFAFAAAAGFVSSWFLAQVPEPPMSADQTAQPLLTLIRQPFADHNFRRLLHFLTSFNFATNFAAPFITVFMLKQLELGLGMVLVLWAASQLANAMTIRLWGQLSDQLSNKSILAVTVPAFFLCLLALPFTAHPTRHDLTLPLLALLHLLMGVATGGSALAIANIGLKLAPRGRGTGYMAATSVFSACAAAVAPIAGGLLADWFARRELALLIHWSAPNTRGDFVLLNLQHWDFFFVLACIFGFYALHALSLVHEGEDVSERAVVQNLVLEARRSMRSLSSIGGLRATIAFPYGRLLGQRAAAGAPLRKISSASPLSRHSEGPPH
ncbi:MFS transporter [Teichococcus vastitatis]|uniref:MFS transporter n=1 Tax=Teichococcus vastitatis TaxID=2307076 RepID=A0ABS9W7P0_9PROT|nr:MFS transporter [Pseudoroseomonas vastitatis]MCI0755314.1 MFS transporter [Pseudoroseomonas vastitatis]